MFFQQGKVLSYRRAIALDRCEQGPFTALAVAPPAKVKAAHKKPAHWAPPVPHHADAK